MSAAAAHFPRSYSEARERFLGAAHARRCRVASHVHPSAQGPDGGELAIDVASAGDRAAAAALVVSCGTHGVEGYAGSGVEAAWLADDAFARAIDRGDVRIVLVHAVNPWGFAHDARTDEGNVDVNRNFRDFARPQARNEGYAELHPLLVPAVWPPRWIDEAKLALAVLEHGRRALQDAITRGQCEFADGLFYGGRAPCWSRRQLEAVFATEGTPCRVLAWIDLHTGLGRCGTLVPICNDRDDPAALARARRYFGADVQSMYAGDAASSEVVGANYAALDAAAATVRASVTLELGTRAPRVVLDALRARQWLANHPDAAPARAGAIRGCVRDAFYVDADAWKDGAYAAVRAVIDRALGGLRRDAEILQ
jgi:hypothetical protein